MTFNAQDFGFLRFGGVKLYGYCWASGKNGICSYLKFTSPVKERLDKPVKAFKSLSP